MAIAAATVWEVRSTATASNVNGGGFNSSNTGNGGSAGTDYSQQDTSQYTFTDLATSTGTTNPSVVTSASHSFVGTDCGNIIHINSGGSFTAGWYEIVSVSAGAATLDRACASIASTSGGTYHVGGAMSLNSSLDSSLFGAMVGGNIAWMKGSFTLGQAVSAFNGGAQAPIVVQGYNSSRGDNPTGANRPSINNGANTLTTGTNVVLKNIIFTGTGTAIITMGAGGVAANCKVTNTSTTAGRTALNFSSANQFIVNCECISYRGIAMAQGSSAVISGSYVHDSDIGIKNSGAVASAYLNNIIANCVTAAIQISAADTANTLYWGNTLYGALNKLGIGLSLATGTTMVRFLNNIVYGFVTGVSHADAGQTVSYDDFNDYFNNTADVTNFTKGGNDVAVDPQFISVGQYTGTNASSSGSVLTDGGANFTNVVAGRDFLYVVSGSGSTVGVYGITGSTATTITTDISLGTASGITYQITTGRNFAVGSNLRATGFPGSFPGGLTTGYLDVGAAQRQEVGGGSFPFGG